MSAPTTQHPDGAPSTTTPGGARQHDGAVLMDAVRAALVRYVVLPSAEAYDAVTLWIAATHAQPCWAHAPRLVIRAPEKRCGKSRLLDLVNGLCHNPLITVNASTAAVYRSIGTQDPPTLLIDEADTIFGPKADSANEDLRGLLNAGHQRNRPAIRYDAAKNRVEAIPTFAMAALAGIGTMPDTIEDRAVVIRMRRRAPGEKVSPFRERRDGPALRRLSQHLAHWAQNNAGDLEHATPAMPVEDRAADTWEPLVAIADHAGRDWPARARAACQALTADHDNTTDVPLRIRLLIDCRTAITDLPAIATADLLDQLKTDPEAPWATYGPSPNGLTAMKLGAMLREYDIRSANIRFPDGTQAKGYHRDAFTDAWNRYCPPQPHNPAGSEPEGQGKPSQPSQASQPSSPRDALPLWDGSSRPNTPSRPSPTSTGTAGTPGTAHPPATQAAICITCRTPLSWDDGTHTHPNCETA
jgi:hypothetical protein